MRLFVVFAKYLEMDSRLRGNDGKGGNDAIFHAFGASGYPRKRAWQRAAAFLFGKNLTVERV
jgi:hypothetical protein